MDDLTMVVLNLVAVGLGAFLTLAVTSISDRLKQGKRRREIARLLIEDIDMQLERIGTAHNILSEIEKQFGSIREDDPDKLRQRRFVERIFDTFAQVADFFDERVFVSLLPELSLLPSDCYSRVMSYCTYADLQTIEALLRK